MKQGIWQYIKQYRQHSIFVRCFALLTILIILPLSAVNIGVHSYYKDVSKNQLAEAYSYSLNKTSDTINMILSGVEKITTHLSVNEEIESFWRYANLNRIDYDTLQKLTKISNLIPSIQIMADYVDSVYVYFDNRKFVISTNLGNKFLNEFQENQWVEAYQKIPADNQVHSIARKAFVQGQEVLYTSFIKKCQDAEGGYGFIINVDMKRLQLVIDPNKGEEETLFIIDNDGNIVYDSKFEHVGKNVKELSFLSHLTDGQEKYVVVDNINMMVSTAGTNEMDWHLLSLISADKMEGKLSWLNWVLAGGFALSLIFSMVVSLILSIWLYNAIKILPEIINGTFSENKILLNRKTYGELNEVILHFFSSKSQNEEMHKELSQYVLSLHKAQVAALQSQINPHFLYNTLDAISWKAMSLTGSQNEVVDMIGSLSKLMRLSTAQENIMTTVEQELEQVKLYVEILRFRYQDRFDLEVQTLEKYGEYLIPKFILQPLVENSMNHGMKYHKNQGHIWIIVSAGEDITIKVVDNGAGINADKLELLRERIKRMEDEDTGDHIGLVNVHRRIRLLFGIRYGLSIDSNEGLGTEITLLLPRQS